MSVDKFGRHSGAATVNIGGGTARGDLVNHRYLENHALLLLGDDTYYNAKGRALRNMAAAVEADDAVTLRALDEFKSLTVAQLTELTASINKLSDRASKEIKEPLTKVINDVATLQARINILGDINELMRSVTAINGYLDRIGDSLLTGVQADVSVLRDKVLALPHSIESVQRKASEELNQFANRLFLYLQLRVDGETVRVPTASDSGYLSWNELFKIPVASESATQ